MKLHPAQKCVCLVVVAAIWCVTLSCSRKDPNIPKVDKAIRLFNGRFNAARFHEIYSDADPRFQQSVSEVDFTQKLSGFLGEHGPIQNSNINGFEGMTRWQRMFPESKPTRFIGIYSKCKNGGFQEFFEFDVTGNDAKLLKFGTDLSDLNKSPRL